jgi:hypothetical protein
VSRIVRAETGHGERAINGPAAITAAEKEFTGGGAQKAIGLSVRVV